MSSGGGASSAAMADRLSSSEARRDHVGDIQRARMLAAMAEEVSERGVSGVTVAHIVARSGVSRRTFYEQFDNCEDCFLAAFEDAATRAWERVRPSYAAGSGWRERIRQALAAFLSFLDSEPSAGRLLVVESLGGGPQALERRGRIVAAVVAAVDEGRKAAKVEPPTLAAEGVVGGVLSILHARLLEDRAESALVTLTSELMATIVLPYLGPSAARRERERPAPVTEAVAHRIVGGNPLNRLDMRLTYRTVRVLTAVAQRPGSSNRRIAEAAGISDQGQISKMLARLHQLGLIENSGSTPTRGEPNAWSLTAMGHQVESAILHG